MQYTEWQHPDGSFQSRPAPGQRYNAVKVDTDGTRLFERTAEIRVRSLKSVGGVRPGCNFTKRTNRRARKAGFVDYKAMIAAFMRMAGGNMNKFRRLMLGA